MRDLTDAESKKLSDALKAKGVTTGCSGCGANNWSGSKTRLLVSPPDTEGVAMGNWIEVLLLACGNCGEVRTYTATILD